MGPGSPNPFLFAPATHSGVLLASKNQSKVVGQAKTQKKRNSRVRVGGSAASGIHPLIPQVAEYGQAVMFPLQTPGGVKMPTLLGTDETSYTSKIGASYPVYSDANGRAAFFLTGHPLGVYLTPDLAGNLRGLDFVAAGSAPWNLPQQCWFVNPDWAQGYANDPAILQAMFTQNSAIRLAAAGASFQLSSAVLTQSGDIASREDYARRFAYGGSVNIGFPVWSQEDTINFEQAANGKNSVVRPATEGIEVYLVPVAGAEDWHGTRFVGYNASAAGTPITGYSLSATDAEQSALLAYFANSLVNNGEAVAMLKMSYGAWSTQMVVMQGLPPNIQVGTLNVAAHFELIAKTKGFDPGVPLSSPPQAQAMVGTQLLVQSAPKSRSLKETAAMLGGMAVKVVGGIAKQFVPNIWDNAAGVANFLLGKAFNLPSKQQLRLQ